MYIKETGNWSYPTPDGEKTTKTKTKYIAALRGNFELTTDENNNPTFLIKKINIDFSDYSSHQIRLDLPDQNIDVEHFIPTFASFINVTQEIYEGCVKDMQDAGRNVQLIDDSGNEITIL